MDDDIEAVARAYCREFVRTLCPNLEPNAVEKHVSESWNCYVDYAATTIAALRALGWRKVGPDEVVIDKNTAKGVNALMDLVSDMIESTKKAAPSWCQKTSDG